MKAVVIDRYGDNDVIGIRDMPKPVPGAEDVLIRVHAASINPVDWKIRQGMTRILTGSKFPKVLGCECSGEVIETGAKVTGLRVGDRVIGFPGIRRLAAFAEYVVVSEKNAFPMSGNISFEEASTLPVAGLTALQSLQKLGHISPDSNVLINGGSGGVGTFAIQIAKIFGARITAVASRPNAPLLKELGADLTLDYRQEDFTKSSERYDIVFDTVSTRSFSECRRVLAPRGVYVNTLPTVSILLYQYGIGFLLEKKARSVMVSPNAADMQWMLQQIEAGRLRVVIDRVYPLDQTAEALAYSETGHARGKVVLTVPEV
ncbi:MAG: NAD(P)-dependent alcohol dehydrogenase [Thermodesulfovibrionales bacterium]